MTTPPSQQPGSNILDLFDIDQDTHQHNSRQSNDIVLARYKTNICQSSFLSTGPKYWTNLPQELTPHKTSLQIHKHHKIYLLS